MVREVQPLQIHRAGTPLREIQPYFRGVPYDAWLMADISRQCEEYARAHSSTDAPITRQRVAGPRDRYGWRSA